MTPEVHKNAPSGNHPSAAHGRDAVCDRFTATRALQRLTRVWTTPVLLVLLDGPMRFAELQRALAPISAKVLAQRLKALERDGHLTRLELVSSAPKTVEYRLTPLGESIRPVVAALAVWEQAVRSHALDR